MKKIFQYLALTALVFSPLYSPDASATLYKYSFAGTFDAVPVTLASNSFSGYVEYNNTFNNVINYSVDAGGETDFGYFSGLSTTTAAFFYSSDSDDPNSMTLILRSPLSSSTKLVVYRNQDYWISNTTASSISKVQVPGPASWLMMLTGLGLLAPLYRRHRKRQLDR